MGYRWWSLAGFFVGYALFRFARLGGGDAKLIAALGLLVGPVGLTDYPIWYMAIAGGVLALSRDLPQRKRLRLRPGYCLLDSFGILGTGFLGLS